jgi:uncharacterized cupin superfamily protein
MSRSLIEVANTAVDLTSSPIDPAWIIEGDPIAQSKILSTSADRLASTIVWQCSEGKFDWYYDCDETILILEGSIVLESETLRPARYGPGDTIFFKYGAHAKWYVDDHVRKIAFCRKTQPVMLGFLVRVISRVRRNLAPVRSRRHGSLMGS